MYESFGLSGVGISGSELGELGFDARVGGDVDVG